MDEKPGFFAKPIVRAMTVLVAMTVIYFAWGYFGGVYDLAADYSLDLIIDLFLFIAGLIIWLVFFAQFVLPVSKLSDRIRVVERLVMYLTGGHGPAVFIESGFVRESVGENRRQGPGVMWLDSASAALVRTEAQFKRAVGPGVHFTGYGEYLAGTHDLHTLIQNIGLEESDEPFTVQKKDENYQKIQDRRWATSALTRDGIEVVSAIGVNFQIKSEAAEGGTFFSYNAANSERAIRDSITRGVKYTRPVCSSLPAKLTVDIWRECLSKVRLDDLFKYVDWGDETTLQFITNLVKDRLSKPTVISLDEFGRPQLKGGYNEQRFKTFCELRKAGKNPQAESMLVKVPSQEFAILNDMGLVVTASVKRVLFAPDVEERLINLWITNWLKNAQEEHERVERRRKLAETAAVDDALQEFALNTIPDLLKLEPTSKSEAITRLVRSTFKGVRRNTTLLKRTNTEQRELFEIYSRLRRRIR